MIENCAKIVDNGYKKDAFEGVCPKTQCPGDFGYHNKQKLLPEQPKWSRRAPKVSPKAPKGPQREPKEIPKGVKREAKMPPKIDA